MSDEKKLFLDCFKLALEANRCWWPDSYVQDAIILFNQKWPSLRKELEQAAIELFKEKVGAAWTETDEADCRRKFSLVWEEVDR